ncbi:MAG: ribosomal L7Ae/L30e/S12e/Gadd45 family protein [Clostridia bacterium]|nr:ribosomal L7Ae/L30e/S12e/Gadd45 family protein [Clostridia bacterium]
MNENLIYNYLGIAQRAGKIVSGENTLISKGNFHKYTLLIIAHDASQAVKKKFLGKAFNHNIDHLLFGNKENLGKAIGKSPRTVLALTDKNISQKIMELIGGEVL